MIIWLYNGKTVCYAPKQLLTDANAKNRKKIDKICAKL